MIRQLWGDWMRRQRKALGMSQLDLALRIGKNSRHVSDYELGKHSPGLEACARIALVLGPPPWDQWVEVMR